MSSALTLWESWRSRRTRRELERRNWRRYSKEDWRNAWFFSTFLNECCNCRGLKGEWNSEIKPHFFKLLVYEAEFTKVSSLLNLRSLGFQGHLHLALSPFIKEVFMAWHYSLEFIGMALFHMAYSHQTLNFMFYSLRLNGLVFAMAHYLFISICLNGPRLALANLS